MTGDRVIRSVIWIFCSSASPASEPAGLEILVEDYGLGDAMSHTQKSNFFDIRNLITLVLHKLGSSTSCIVRVCSDGISGIQSRANIRQPIEIKKFNTAVFLIPFRLDFVPQSEMKRGSTGRFDCTLLFLQVDDLRLVDRTVGEASFVCRLVEDHGVLHVIPSIRDNGDDGVGSVREGVHAVSVMKGWAHDRTLSTLKSIELVVCSMPQRRRWCAHRLFTHLGQYDEEKRGGMSLSFLPDIDRYYGDSVG